MGNLNPTFLSANQNGAPDAPAPIRLGLVLPGGGALGKFSHGALKELASDQRFQQMLASGQIEIHAITGTSAGAVTGTIITGHLNAGNGLQGGVRALDKVWGTISSLGVPAQLRQRFMRAVFPLFTPSYPNLSAMDEFMMEQATAALPEGMAPTYIAELLEANVPQWRHVQNGKVSLYVNAVKAPQKGQSASHVTFNGTEITPQTAAASTALKTFGGLTINGTKYWDGGYWRNPCLDGLLQHDLTDMLVLPLCAPPKDITPGKQDEWSTTGKLSNKKTVSVELYHELAHLRETRPDLNQHIVYLQPESHWGESVKMNNAPEFMAELEARGRLAMRQWLDHNLPKLGQTHSVVDHKAPVLTGPAPTSGGWHRRAA